jgi:hypothetical protein
VIVCFVDIGGIVDHHFKLSFRNTSSEEMPGPGLGQAHKCGRLKLINVIPTLTL